VEKILLIAFCAGQTTWQDVYASQAGGFGASSNAGDGFFVQANVIHNSTWADILAAELELGFDENKKIRAWLGACRGGAKYFANGDERNVGDGEICLLRDILGRQFAGVAFDGDDARILLELPCELGGVYIDGIDARSAFLQQAIGEATGGGAYV
jgi:hypothetical protein